MRSMSAECIGSAYMSGSSLRAHRKFVNARAMRSEEDTAMQKNSTENATNINGSFSHPSPARTLRKIISTGSVTTSSVIITSVDDGSGAPLTAAPGVSASAAACRRVDSRDVNIAPTAPGRPLMTTARSAKPS